MEPYNKNQEPKEVKDNNKAADQWGRGRMWGGLVVIAVGAIWIAREAGVDIPRWLISPPMFLVAVGIFIGARQNFRHWFWLIPVAIGAALLVDRIFWEINIKPFIWPAVIIAVGLFMIFRPKKRDSGPWIDWQKASIESNNVSATGEEDTIDAVAVFGSTKKNILSKNFRGGEIVNFFGGTELNLSQADIHGPVLLELVQVFGGAKLIVPANWRIQSELVSVFGGVDDKRMIQPNIDPTKVLVLKGTNVFGGLEIKSY
jgi:predicted membrane protein